MHSLSRPNSRPTDAAPMAFNLKPKRHRGSRCIFIDCLADGHSTPPEHKPRETERAKQSQNRNGSYYSGVKSCFQCRKRRITRGVVDLNLGLEWIPHSVFGRIRYKVPSKKLVTGYVRISVAPPIDGVPIIRRRIEGDYNTVHS